MPYKTFTTERVLIPRDKKLTVKIPLSMHEEIRNRYAVVKSQRKVALEYGVSRRLITFIIDSNKYERSKAIRRTKHKEYYDKNRNREYMRKFRHSKYERIKKGELKEEVIL